MTDVAPVITERRGRLGARDAVWLACIAASVIALDQLTKWIIRQTIEFGESVPEGWPIRLVYYTNSGAAFGLFQGAGTLLAFTSIIGVFAIIFYVLSPAFGKPLMRVGLALMLGGAIGNLIDRVARGEVDDFLKVPHWPAFNVADSAITIGVLLLLWTLITDDRPEGQSSS